MKQHIGYIENGINLDHIPHGKALFITRILKLFNSDRQVGIGLNLPSSRLGQKDLIKIEGYHLSAKELQAISLFAPGATLSIIKNFEVIDKKQLTLPDYIDDLIVCLNQRCVSHLYKSKFNVFLNRKPEIVVKCHYCEQEALLNDIDKYNI